MQRKYVALLFFKGKDRHHPQLICVASIAKGRVLLWRSEGRTQRGEHSTHNSVHTLSIYGFFHGVHC